jgi:hypothetical protein
VTSPHTRHHRQRNPHRRSDGRQHGHAPLAAACLGFVGRQWRLAYRAVITLVVGPAVTGLAAAVIAVPLDLIRNLPPGLSAEARHLAVGADDYRAET